MSSHSLPQAEPTEQGLSRREFATRAMAGAASLALPAPAVAQSQAASPPGTPSRSPSKLIRVDKRTPQLWRITIDHPPFNLVVPEMVSALHAVVVDMEREPDLRVVVIHRPRPGSTWCCV